MEELQLQKAIENLTKTVKDVNDTRELFRDQVLEELNVVMDGLKDLKKDFKILSDSLVETKAEVKEMTDIKLQAKGALWLGKIIGGSGVLAAIWAYLKHNGWL